MAIKSMKVLNVMVFQRQSRKNNASCMETQVKAGDIINDSFELEFSDGINVIIGENGVGKTTVLKMVYAATQWSNEKTKAGKTKRLSDFFSSNLKDTDLIKNNGRREDYSFFEITDGMHTFKYSLSHKGIINFDDWLGLEIPSVFIPTTEMLSHSKGFLALNEKYRLPFDGTQVDIIVNASLPETRKIPEYVDSILEKISNVIDGTVVMEEDTFYVQKKNGDKIDFSLEAEGLRKLGLLWKLIRNGLIEKDTILLWDEPESNLNPELFPLVVDILLELVESGVQVFVATHSYNLAKYFETRRKKLNQVEFHNLYKASSKIPEILVPFKDDNQCENEVYGTSAFYLSELKGNKIVEADEKLLDEALTKNLID